MSGMIPRMSLHKASGQAVVRLGGIDLYLGPWGSSWAKSEYDRRIAEWLASGRRGATAAITETVINEIIAAFWDHAQSYYRHPDGTPTNELRNFRDALRFLRRMYGHRPVMEFGPLALKAVRTSMIDAHLCRGNINRHISRIKHLFKWSAANELIPPSIFQALQAVDGLRAGRTEARESEPVKPVSDQAVNEVLPLVSRQVAAMIKLQLITGARSGEIVSMRGVDIDTTGKVWVYHPTHHKTQHLGHDRTIYYGKRAQAIITPFLRPNLEGYLFSPADAETERRRKKLELRKAPLSCGNRAGSNIKRFPKKKPKDRYTVESYCRAIKYAIERLYPLPLHLARRIGHNGKVEILQAWQARLTLAEKAEIKAWRKAHSWHPHQLRHSAATNLRKTYGLEPAQVILGHKTLTVTQVYAEKNVEAAMRIMAEVG
jgi:integrase